MYRSAEAEYDHVVAGLYDGVTVYEHSVSVAYQSGDGHVARQSEIFHRSACYLGFRLHLDLGNIGVGKRHEFRRCGVGVEKQLEDIGRSEQFLVDHGADV